MLLPEREHYDRVQMWRGEMTPGQAAVARIVERLVPGEVSSILDVGCGSGAASSRVGRFRVGVDHAYAALQESSGHRLVAVGGALPVRDASFDLVMAVDVLEHLSPADLAATVAELRRASRRWLLIGVPFLESLPSSRAVCPVCAESYHVNWHQRAFDWAGLCEALGTTPVAVANSGEPWSFDDPDARWIENQAGASAEWEHASCPACGHRGSSRASGRRALAASMRSRAFIRDLPAWRVRPPRAELLALFDAIAAPPALAREAQLEISGAARPELAWRARTRCEANDAQAHDVIAFADAARWILGPNSAWSAVEPVCGRPARRLEPGVQGLVALPATGNRLQVTVCLGAAPVSVALHRGARGWRPFAELRAATPGAWEDVWIDVPESGTDTALISFLPAADGSSAAVASFGWEQGAAPAALTLGEDGPGNWSAPLGPTLVAAARTGWSLEVRPRAPGTTARVSRGGVSMVLESTNDTTPVEVGAWPLVVEQLAPPSDPPAPAAIAAALSALAEDMATMAQDLAARRQPQVASDAQLAAVRAESDAQLAAVRAESDAQLAVVGAERDALRLELQSALVRIGQLEASAVAAQNLRAEVDLLRGAAGRLEEVVNERDGLRLQLQSALVKIGGLERDTVTLANLEQKVGSLERTIGELEERAEARSAPDPLGGIASSLDVLLTGQRDALEEARLRAENEAAARDGLNSELAQLRGAAGRLEEVVNERDGLRLQLQSALVRIGGLERDTVTLANLEHKVGSLERTIGELEERAEARSAPDPLGGIASSLDVLLMGQRDALEEARLRAEAEAAARDGLNSELAQLRGAAGRLEEVVNERDGLRLQLQNALVRIGGLERDTVTLANLEQKVGSLERTIGELEERAEVRSAPNPLADIASSLDLLLTLQRDALEDARRRAEDAAAARDRLTSQLAQAISDLDGLRGQGLLERIADWSRLRRSL